MPVNLSHLTKQGHAMNRVHLRIKEHQLAGTLGPETINQIREAYWDEVDGLDVPPNAHDGLHLTLALIGDGTPEEMARWKATNNPVAAEERDKFIAQWREDYERAQQAEQS